MNTKAIQLVLAGVLTLAAVAAQAADDQTRQSGQTAQSATDLQEEIASPASGEFAHAGETLRSGWQQDVGGLSGNANGMDGMPTATGGPTSYPDPTVPAGY